MQIFSYDATGRTLWRIFSGSGREVGTFDRAEAIELRDLLLREFPLCPGPAEPAQAAEQPPAEPDVDEVRRAIDLWEWDGGTVGVLRAAARAYLRMREQQPQQHPTIEQVVEACGGDDLIVYRDNPGILWFAERGRCRWGSWTKHDAACADTPEAALLKLYADAKAKWERQRDEAIEKLARLEVR
jgi:hypothetical protein